MTESELPVERMQTLRTRWLRDVVEDDALIEHRLLILLVIGAYMNKDGEAFVNMRTLARKTNMKQQTIIKMLDKLAEETYISIDSEHPESRNHYTYHIQAVL